MYNALMDRNLEFIERIWMTFNANLDGTPYHRLHAGMQDRLRDILQALRDKQAVTRRLGLDWYSECQDAIDWGLNEGVIK